MTVEAPRVKADQPVSRWWALVILAVVFTVAWIVSRFEPEVIAEAAGGSAGVALYLLIMLWSSRARVWFWPFMTSVVAVHIIAVVTIPWPLNHRWLKGDTVFGVVDLFAWLGVALLLDRFIKNSEDAEHGLGQM